MWIFPQTASLLLLSSKILASSTGQVLLYYFLMSVDCRSLRGTIFVIYPGFSSFGGLVPPNYTSIKTDGFRSWLAGFCLRPSWTLPNILQLFRTDMKEVEEEYWELGGGN